MAKRRDETESEIKREEVERALKEIKVGKALGVDGVRAEIIKGGKTVVNWLVRLLMYVLFYQWYQWTGFLQ